MGLPALVPKSGPGFTRRVKVLSCLLLAAMTVAAVIAASANNDKKKKDKHQYALLFGTVFDARGLSVRGVEVRVRQKEGKKRWQALTNSQGEFAFQLPVGTAAYVVEVAPAGFSGDSKEVVFSGDERQDVVLRVAQRQEK